MLICFRAIIEEYTGNTKRLNTSIVDTNDNNFKLARQLEVNLNNYFMQLPQEKVIDLLNKGTEILGLNKDAYCYIDKDYMEMLPSEKNSYLYTETHKIDKYLFIGNKKNVYLLDLEKDKQLGKIAKIPDTVIQNIQFNRNIVSIDYSLGYSFAGRIKYKITSKGIFPLVKDKIQKVKNNQLQGIYDFPVDKKYAFMLLKNLGISLNYNDSGFTRDISCINNESYLGYELINDILCVEFRTNTGAYYVGKDIVFVGDYRNSKCIYRKGELIC
jgi:hypothetical protein